MLIKPPTTLADFEQVKTTILELMANKYCDQTMYLALVAKLAKVNAKIATYNQPTQPCAPTNN